MTGFYQRHICPRLIHWACSAPQIAAQRTAIVPQAQGVVLEVGIGSGLNLAHYDVARVRAVIGIDPSPTLLDYAKDRAGSAAFPVELIEGCAEALPLEAASADCALLTYTLCSVSDVMSALGEVRRVLKPGGELLFCEHGRAHNASTAAWQDRLTPIWKRLSGGCHLNRDVEQAIRECGFNITSLETFTLPRTPGLVGFHYRGAARSR